MSSTQRFRGHDFESNRQRLRQLLKEQESLSDFDVEGSVFDTIISVLADVTEKNSISANTLFAESQPNTATLRRNLSNHARNYGYVPFSSYASRANVDLVLTLTDFEDLNQFTISKGAVFDAGDIDHPFSIVETVSADRSVTNDFRFEDVDLRQGIYTSFEQIYSKETIKIDFDGVDVSLLEVYVQEELDTNTYSQWSGSFDRIRTGADDPVFFLSEFGDGKYQIEFGDGVIGRKPKNGAIIKVVVFLTKGSTGNGFTSFEFVLTPDNSSLLRSNAADVSVLTKSKAAGGTDNESDDSLRRNISRFLTVQNRAVTLRDYDVMIRNRFPYIRSTSVWSGSESGSDRFEQPGRIYISLNSTESSILTESQKEEISDSVRNDFGIFAITPVLVDAEVTRVDVDVEVFVTNQNDFRNSTLVDEIRRYIQTFGMTNLSDFNNEFRLSQFSAGVDSISETVSSNLVSVMLSKDFSPTLQQNNNFEIDFHNSIETFESNEFTIFPSLRRVKVQVDGSDIILTTVDDDGNVAKIDEKVGTIDLDTGLVSISNLRVQRFNDVTKTIRFFARPKSKNIKPRRNNILQIGNSKIRIGRS